MASKMPNNTVGADAAWSGWIYSFDIEPGVEHKPSKGLYTGSGGTIVVQLVGHADGEFTVYENVAAGIIMPWMVAAVLADDGASPAVATDAEGIKGGW